MYKLYILVTSCIYVQLLCIYWLYILVVCTSCMYRDWLYILVVGTSCMYKLHVLVSSCMV